jgi:hypothetical protein
LSCSHETFFICGESWAKSHRYPMRAYRNTFVAGRCRPHFCKSRLFGAGTLGGRASFQQFFDTMPRRSRPHWRRSPV